MEGPSKRSRTNDDAGTGSMASAGGGDRLSALPDSLLHEIMSRMQARQVVQTCVLSTRWRHLWRSVPCLDIDEEEFETAGPNSYSRKEWNDFVDFTDHLLIPNIISIAQLDTFRLHLSTQLYTYCNKENQAARWIRHVIKYSRQDHPGIQHKELNSIPWRLKRLHLSNVSLDGSFMNHVSSGCQYLEDMELKGCRCGFREITSPTLKSLILKNCDLYGLSAVTPPMLKRLVFDGCKYASNCHIMAPAVGYLLLDVVGPNSFKDIDVMPSLAEASIFLWHCEASEFRKKCEILVIELSKGQIKLLCRVSNVTNLVLSSFQTMVTGVEFPEFHNLRTLLLEKCNLSDNFQTLGHFLQHSPNLEKLTLSHCMFSKYRKTKKGKAKLNKEFLNQFDVRCKNLNLTEIIYTDDDVQKLVELLLSISGDLPKNNIKLTKVDPGHP